MGALRGAVAVAVVAWALPAQAAVIQVTPSDDWTKIEGAQPGDEVVLAPGTYAFRVYLTQQAPANAPIFIHSQDPSNPAVVDFGSTLTDDAPGSYTAGDRGRGCWQLSGASNIHIDGIVFQNCRNASMNAAGIRYYNGTTGFLLTNCVFRDNDNGLTGGTMDTATGTQSDATVEWCEFDHNGNPNASAATHNIYNYGGFFTLRYSYLHDPAQAENAHIRAVDSTIEYNWFDRAGYYDGDLMTNDDYANNPGGAFQQTMLLRGNVIIQDASQGNNSQIWAIYNDAASGSPVTFSVIAEYNTVVGAGGHAAFVHLSNADGTAMTAQVDNNIISGTSQPILVEDSAAATVSGTNNYLDTGAPAGGLSNSIFGSDPGYTSASGYDFTLASGSVCIAAADPGAGHVPTQEYYKDETLTREYRLRASANDLGAFEHDTQGSGIGPYDDGGLSTSNTSSSSSSASSSSTSSSTTGGTTSASSSSGTASSSATGSSSSTSSGVSSSGTASTSASGSSGGTTTAPGTAKGGCGCSGGGEGLELLALAFAALARRRVRAAAERGAK